MARWKIGEAEIKALISNGEIQKLTGEAANGELLLAKASTTLTTARSAIETDPDSAFVLAYDASRQALTALLAHQGLRPTAKGGHYAVERAARAQFGQGFRQFGALRRRRNELEYPSAPATNQRSRKRLRPSTTQMRSSPQPKGCWTSSACSEPHRRPVPQRPRAGPPSGPDGRLSTSLTGSEPGRTRRMRDTWDRRSSTVSS